MDNFLVVSFETTLEEQLQLAKEYKIAFEINDFYEPDLLDNPEEIDRVIERYLQNGIPANSTMHGAFYDIVIHSRDAAIRDISKRRMRQSMEIADRLGVCAVVFHTNYQPQICGDCYERAVIEENVKFVRELLEEYPHINIYLENMFDDRPGMLVEISKGLKEYANYGICLDYGHAFVYGNDIREWVEATAPFLKHVHINDNDLKEDLHQAVGSGSIDWKEFAVFYRQYFSQCSVLVEVYDIDKQKASLEFLAGLL